MRTWIWMMVPATLLVAGCELAIPDSVKISTGDAAPGGGACIDADNDGICASTDCDDNNAARGGEEICDSVDNDCDGLTDEGFDVGQPCSVLGSGGCQSSGFRVCIDGISVCSATVGPFESCNGVDDDCDGIPDEGNPGGGGLCDGGGEGACGGGAFLCSAGALGCVATVTPGQLDEICNNADDDCDGMVDEASGGDPGVPLGAPLEMPCYGGPAGTAGTGDCAAGTWSCTAGRWGACTGETRPRAPKCDSVVVDADCNGVPDGTQDECLCGGVTTGACYGGPPGTVGVGPCVAGTRNCVSGSWSACSGEVVPVRETCNGQDDDCDGSVDEDFDVGEVCSVGLGACAGTGEFVCAGTSSSACDATMGTPGEEACNGVDDDCDGRLDEVPGEGSACTVGLGACARPGVMACDGGVGVFACNAVAGPPAAEICNGIDDNCNGVVDEGFADLGEPCTVGVGACQRTGTYICSPVTALRICDVQEGGPSNEVCDGLDNDCDGHIDEGFGVGNACVAAGVCGPGVLECGALGQARCSTALGGSDSGASAELCNSLDDDCDGLVDETFYGLGTMCWGCMSAVGSLECHSGGSYTQCSTGTNGSQVPAEICDDDFDNDCDGQFDEVVCVED